MLNLKTITAIKIEENGDHDYHIHAVANSEPSGCPECSNDAIYGHGKKVQLFMDVPIHGRRVGIFLERKRYRCRQCKTTFYQACDDIDDSHRATKRLVGYIEKTAIIKTCVSVAHDVGLSEGSIRGILKNYTEKLNEQYSFETPEILGIDEVHLNREMRLVLINIGERTIVDMIDNRNKKAVINALYRFKSPTTIKIVTMDMWRPYRDAVAAVLPHAVVVIDKFHVVKMANEAVEKGRKDLRSKLDKELIKRLKKDRYLMLKRRRDLDAIQELLLSSWAANFPELADLYHAKECFFDIWDSNLTGPTAEAAYEAWKNSVPAGIRGYFSNLTRAIDNWHIEVFNYFDQRLTNAYTESANNHIKSIAQQGRGYSFEVLRARVLFVGAKHKIKPKPFKHGVDEKSIECALPDDLFINYGVEFPVTE
ncbi:MAG: ISL3 family transposase [Methylococcales bacterium]|nr:ISL3 family transposase [Methylococcales bacterium]